MRQVARYAIIALLTLVSVVALWKVANALILFLLSLAVAASVRPAVGAFVAHRLSRVSALLLTYTPLIVITGGLTILAMEPMLVNINQAANDLMAFYTQTREAWLANQAPFLQTLAQQLPPTEDLFAALQGEGGLGVLYATLAFTAQVADLLGALLIVVVLSAYWSLDHVHFERIWLSLLSGTRRTQARRTWRAMENQIGTYVRSQVIVSAVAAILLWLGYWLMPFDYAVLLALFAALARLIPYLGILIAAIPPLTAGLALGPGWGIAAAVYTAVILKLLEVILRPRLGCCESYSPILLILVSIALGESFGLPGLVLALPLTVAIQVIFDYAIQIPSPEETPDVVLQTNPEATRVIKVLEEKIETTKEMMVEAQQPTTPGMENLIGRLEELVQKVHLYLHW